MYLYDSLELVNAVLEDNFATLVNDAVHDAGHREDPSDDAAHRDQELYDVLSSVSVLHCEG